MRQDVKDRKWFTENVEKTLAFPSSGKSITGITSITLATQYDCSRFKNIFPMQFNVMWL